MKTKEELEKKREEIIQYIKGNSEILSTYQKNKELKELQKIKFLILYLETNPNEKYVARSMDNLKNKIKIINSKFLEWRSNTTDSPRDEIKAKQQYASITNLEQLQEQLEILNYLYEFRTITRTIFCP